MDPNVQDWETRVIRKSVKPVHQSQVSHPASAIKTTFDTDGDEVVKLKTVSHEMAQFIIKTRVEKGLKQIDLAKRACIDAKAIANIERGGCVYNANDINKIAKAMGVNIPRK
jgi:ribosome-binding protein aMBF1 (putative translation factor)